MTQLVLASTSPYRKEILQQVGLRFKAVAPRCDEDSLKDPLLTAEALTVKLAEHKAMSLQSEFSNDVIIGSDQVLEYNGRIFGKPKTRENALRQLIELSGQSHHLITSAVLLGPQGLKAIITDKTQLKMRRLTQQEVESYLEWEKPFDCAGSYKIEKRGVSLFESINSQDFNSIKGLPLIRILNQLNSWNMNFWETISSLPHGDLDEIKARLFTEALEAQKNSYAPYSKAHIASSILWSDGSISSGSNIENSSYGATVCAERVAIWKGLSENKNKKLKYLLVLSDANPPWPPCGMCRQVMSEFADPNLKIFLANKSGMLIDLTWQEVFPHSFTPSHLGL